MYIAGDGLNVTVTLSTDPPFCIHVYITFTCHVFNAENVPKYQWWINNFGPYHGSQTRIAKTTSQSMNVTCEVHAVRSNTNVSGSDSVIFQPTGKG